MFPKPPVDAFFLAGVDHPLPADISSAFIVLGHYILRSGENGNRAIDPEPPAKIRVIDNTAVFHIS